MADTANRNPGHPESGCGFLLVEAGAGSVFTPEDFSDEQRLIAETARQFAEESVLPLSRQIEEKEPGVVRSLLEQAGELGLLGADIPDEYGGLSFDKVTSALISESIAVNGSFYVAFSAHSGIGTLPLVWYGSQAQKQRYLPKLATAETVAAYALSESSSGSDALNVRTRASLSEDGTYYLLNGEKMWISNAGIADLFTVFAKVDGERFTAFLIEAKSPGLTIGAEEHKMGIRGSSTCPVILNGCKVPSENVLGEVGKGHLIAFNILNAGRYKLGALAVGAAKHSFQSALRYSKERKAFGKAISRFGLIQEKLAECAADIYAGEALVYRLVGAIDESLAKPTAPGENESSDISRRIEEYVVECSLAKVWCSEMLGRVVDHGVQIYGGNGFTEDYPAARSYCDARVTRIFEGTNEINRLLITGWIFKRAAQGRLPLLPAITRAMNAPRSTAPDLSDPIGMERALLGNARELTLYCMGIAHQKYGGTIVDEQEISGALADMAIQIYVLESAILRATKNSSPLAIDLVRYFASGVRRTIVGCAERILADGDAGDLGNGADVLSQISRAGPANIIAAGRRIAESMLAAGRYRVPR